MREALTILTTDRGLRDGEGEGVAAGERGLRLQPRDDAFPNVGTWTWPEQAGELAFTELLPSWIVITPPDTGVRFSGRVRDAASGAWSPWLDFGYWGRVPPPQEAESFDGGRVKVDVLALERPANAWQMRVRFYSYRLDADVPAVRQLAVSASGPGEPAAKAEPTAWSGVLDVPFIPQATAGPKIGGEVCSPTSLTMVATYHGEARPLVENCAAIFDTEHGLFGNWNRAVARAGELGLSGHLDRFYALDKARRTIADGTPIIASINFKEGEAPSFVMKRTSGHLIVLRGVTADGDFVVNDPASAERGEGAIYKARELQRAWIDNAGGVGYVITRPGDSPRPD